MGKKHFCYFQIAETGNRFPNSGVKGSGANHYPRAPALRDTECFNVVNSTLVYGCFNICTTIPVASHRLGTTTLIQLWYNVGTTIPDLETREFKDKEIFWSHGNFRDTECFNVVNAILVYGCFNICTKHFAQTL